MSPVESFALVVESMADGLSAYFKSQREGTAKAGHDFRGELEQSRVRFEPAVGIKCGIKPF